MGNTKLASEMAAEMIECTEGVEGIDALDYKLEMFFKFGVAITGALNNDKFLDLLKKTDALNVIQKYEKIQNLKKSIDKSKAKLEQKTDIKEQSEEEERILLYSQLKSVLDKWNEILKKSGKDTSLREIWNGQRGV